MIQLAEVPAEEVERVRRFVIAMKLDQRPLDGNEGLRVLAWWGLVRAESEQRKEERKKL